MDGAGPDVFGANQYRNRGDLAVCAGIRCAGEIEWMVGPRAEASRRGKWMYEIIERGLSERFHDDPTVRKELPSLEQKVREGRITSFRAARSLLEIYRAGRT